MPLPESGLHDRDGPPAASALQHSDAAAAPDCHGAIAMPLDPAGAALGLHHVAAQADDCQDDHCQLCGVCHQGLNLAQWPLQLPLVQTHPLPINAAWVNMARFSAPLTKPPIS
ncbi:hypothetical protein ACHEXK_12540 [Limnohabitans sp. DCL3]|uniref:hypothetical protein n=1 Tax=Limnohabitans sp. DCL3 TaxID=3374103 RepID=UPI003A8607E1